MQQIFSNTTLSVNQLIEQIDTGILGLPELQRPFIWQDSKVRDLFDSMMRGYPIGYFMLWECPALEKKKTIGVDAHNYETPRQVIIDGQQRLTSLYAVMKGKKVINSKYDEKTIVISYCPLKNKFEVGYQATKKDPEWIYNISEVFTTGNITKLINNFTKKLEENRTSKGGSLSEEEQDLISENISALSNLRQHTLPVFDIKANTEEEDVSDIFVRVNSGGVALKQNDFILTLLSLYWDEGRKQLEKFSKESTYPQKDKVTSYNQITEVTAQDIIRVVMAYAFDRGRLKYGYKLLRGADFDKKGAVDEDLRNQRFDILKEKLPDVLNVHNWHEFLKAIMNAGYLSGDMILSGTALYYSYAFYLIAKYRFDASYNENMHLTSLWFFYASLVSLYTGSFESTVENHLNTIKELKSMDEYREFILSRVEERLTKDYFDITLVGSEGLAVSGRGNNAWNAYVATLNILNAKILFSKCNLLVSKLFEPGTDGNRKSLEKHHLFPKAYLKTLGYTDSKINQMANYAFIDWKDNMEILDEAPSKYYPIICEGRSQEDIAKMEEENALPSGWENMSYEDFLIERRKLMAAKIKAAFEVLKKNVERPKKKVLLNYCTVFGKLDVSDSCEWEEELSSEEEQVYKRAKVLRLDLNEQEELEAVLHRAYPKIEKNEIENCLLIEDEYTQECTGHIKVSPDRINKLVAERDPYTLKYFGLTEKTEEELNNWDASKELNTLPLVCDFEQDFQPSSPFDRGWLLRIRFAEEPDNEELTEEEARQTITKLLGESKEDYSIIDDYLSRCSELYVEDETIYQLAYDIAQKLGRPDANHFVHE